MAFHTLNITLTGAADRVTTTHTPVRQVRFFNVTGNDAVLVGASDLSATIYGESVAAAASSSIFGPFSGDAPMNLEDFYLKGTNGNVVRCWYIKP